MSEEQPLGAMSDDARLASLGYRPQLNRVLGSFANFSVAFTYLSPMVGIYSLFALGVAAGGPAYVWLTWIPVVGMLFVALVFGELASHYPVAGALYQYSKFSVGPSYGWFVGWFYGMALLITVAAVDTGVVTLHDRARAQLVRLELRPDQPPDDPGDHRGPGGHPDRPEHHRRPGDGPRRRSSACTSRSSARWASRSSWPSTASTTGSGSCSAPRARRTPARNALGLDFGGNWLTGAALIAVLAPVYIFYGFESAGDISEETKDAGVKVPRSMRQALIWGGVVVVHPDRGAAAGDAVGQGPGREDRGRRRRAVHPRRAAQRAAGLPAADDHLRVLLLRHLGAGRGQPAGVLVRPRRRAAGLRMDRARAPRASRRPTNALLAGAVVTMLFVLLVFYSPSKDVKIGFITYPANINALVVAGLVRRQRHLPVVPADRDRGDHRPVAGLGARGPVPAGQVGLDGHDRGRGVPRPDAAQRRGPDRPDAVRAPTSTSTGSPCW